MDISECARAFRIAATAILSLFYACIAGAAELKPPTIAAFERYQRAAESAIDADLATPETFLRIYRPNAARRQDVEPQLQQGHVVVARLQASENGKRIEIPDGLVHHWVATVFVRGVHLDAAVSMMQAYDRHSQFFRPNVVQSKTLEHAGDRYRLFLRFFFRKGISVTVNTESEAIFTRWDASRVSSAIRSTRIAEVEHPGTIRERELPVGRDSGYLWRLNTYWRFWERDGGTYIECESLTLTRGIPLGLGWLIGPFVTSIPRETLTLTLEATRRTLAGKQPSTPVATSQTHTALRAA
jgi:hypothetical protein